MSTLPEKSLQLRSLIKPEGELELSLVEVDMPIETEDDTELPLLMMSETSKALTWSVLALKLIFIV